MALGVSYFDEFTKLNGVILYRPDPEEIEQDNAQKAMYQSIPNVSAVLKEFDEIVSTFIRLGVKVIVLNGRKTQPKTPNMIYLRDVAFVYQSKILKARMKHEVRKAEPLKFSELLSQTAPSLAKEVIDLKRGLVEGADLLVNSNQSLLSYIGSRTNQAAVNEIKELMGIETSTNIPANINGVPQHLLGGIHIIDKNLLTRRSRYCKQPILGYNEILFGETKEISEGFALNIVTLRPKEILMPSNRPETKQMLENHGVTCHEVHVEEIHKMGGGLACMTLPFNRGGA